MVSVARKENDNQLGILLNGHVAGLAILAQIYSHSHLQSSNIHNNSNIVLKSGLRSPTTTPITTNQYSSSSSSSSSSTISSCVSVNDGDYYQLKSCNLCSKPFRPDQDIYMYRGDQGFCSEKCRNRQIILDERREKEELAQLAKKNKVGASSPSIDCRGCETCRLLEDLRQRRRLRGPNNDYKPKQQPILSIS